MHKIIRVYLRSPRDMFSDGWTALLAGKALRHSYVQQLRFKGCQLASLPCTDDHMLYVTSKPCAGCMMPSLNS
jgi:tRNA(Arg) A34 adenosine deaminase TadA